MEKKSFRRCGGGYCVQIFIWNAVVGLRGSGDICPRGSRDEGVPK